MKFLKPLLSLTGLFLLLGSCTDESPFTDNSNKGGGKINLNLTSSSEVSSAMPNVRSVTKQVVPPPVSDFQIRLSKTDGSYAKTWSSLEEFAKETEFSVGMYELEAYYGTPDSQGVVKSSDKGYEHAYYYGKVEDIVVKESQETNVTIGASLANSIVVVEYTDAYKNYFRSWNTTLKTSGKENVELGDEEGTCYVTPGVVDIVMDAVLENGNSVFLNPAEFDAEPCHMYKIKYDVFNGENGSVILSLNFNDDPEEIHDVWIELNDELVNAEAPVVNAVGFESGALIETQVGIPFDQDVQFEVIAKAGISQAVLKVNSDTYTASFLNNGQIDLCVASPQQQGDMEKAGIKARGFFNNPETMAFLDLTEFCKNLPAGKHKISLQITDKYSQTNDPDSPYIEINAVDTESAIVKTESYFGENCAYITVEYDGPDPTQNGKNPFSFKFTVPRTGLQYPVEIKAIGTESNPLTRATYEKHQYVYQVTLPEEASDYYPVSMYFNGGSKPVDDSHEVEITYPDYTVEYDAFAKKILLKVKEEDSSKLNLYNENLRIFVNDQEIKNATLDATTGILTIPDLKSDSDYKVKTTLRVSSTPDIFSEEVTLHTEKEVGVPNGDFEQLTALPQQELNQGGTWSTSILDGAKYQNKTKFTISEAKNWATNNQKTLSGSPDNTWFVIPSVFNSSLEYTSTRNGVGTLSSPSTPESYSGFIGHNNSNNAMVIRNVAWDPSGTVPSKCTKAPKSSGKDYYNHTEATVSKKSVGTMFLGEYSYTNGREEFKQGCDFESRPLKLTGYYIYTLDKISQEVDHGVITVQICNDEEVLAEGTSKLKAVASYSSFSIDLNYKPFGKKANQLKIMINSSEKDENDISVSTYLSQYESYKHGATLVVDDFTFEY